MSVMKKLGLVAAASLFAGVALAQTTKTADGTVASDSAKKENPVTVTLFRAVDINHYRPADSRGLNQFETPKESTVPFTGFTLSIGGAFTQEFQGLTHTNTAAAVVTNGVNANQLIA